MAVKYSHIIWDWNGTLYDDVEWCVSVTNAMLNKRGIKVLEGITEYRNVFGFPVKDYCMRIGYDFVKETFEEISKEFIELYSAADETNCRLNGDAKAVLEAIYRIGIRQVVLSASEIGNLNKQINRFNIGNYFDVIMGLMDTYAKSKVEVGLEFIRKGKIERAVLIGDTVHDFEVAVRLGVDCVLVTGGHQDKNRLLKCKVPVLDGISEVIEYIK